MDPQTRESTEEDIEQIAAIRQEAFRRPTTVAPWLNGSGRVVARESEVCGIARAEPAGQYFGGRRVSSAGITSVAVGVRFRKQGIARRLLGDVLREQRDQGVSLAALYPSSPTLYRGLGFEVAGTRFTYSTTVMDGKTMPDDGSLDSVWSEWSDSMLAEISECYEEFASHRNGVLSRERSWWDQFITYAGVSGPLYCFRVYDGSRLVGYALCSHEPADGRTPYDFWVHVRDIAYLTGNAAATLVSFLTSQWPYQRGVSWPGPPADPLFRVFASSVVAVESSYPWMLRILNLQSALEDRGYPAGASASTALAVSDPLLPENSRRVRIEVSEGRACVSDTRENAAAVDVGTLAAIYTGWLSPRDASRLGLLEGAQEDHLANLELMFTGQTPWISEFF
ncbi:MAG: GNAT family N-acetyltransferase [Chloroflexota bacterium]